MNLLVASGKLEIQHVGPSDVTSRPQNTVKHFTPTQIGNQS